MPSISVTKAGRDDPIYKEGCQITVTHKNPNRFKSAQKQPNEKEVDFSDSNTQKIIHNEKQEGE